MKQQILNLKKKLLLVELPVKCDGEDISISHDQYDYDQLEFQYPTQEFRGLQCYDNILLPKGNNYKSVGKLTDITEEQFKECVERFSNKVGASLINSKNQRIDLFMNYFLLPLKNLSSLIWKQIRFYLKIRI